MMKRILLPLFVMSLLSLLIVTTAFAQEGPAPNNNNCAGVVVSSLAGPGFGGQVAAAAHLQLVDNFGLASCGDNPRQNP